jgi:hypothetical protein
MPEKKKAQPKPPTSIQMRKICAGIKGDDWKILSNDKEFLHLISWDKIGAEAFVKEYKKQIKRVQINNED